MSTPAIWCRIVRFRHVHPCYMVPYCPVPRCPPLLYGATWSVLALSTPAIWCRVVQSRDVSPHNFDGLAMSSSAFSVAPHSDFRTTVCVILAVLSLCSPFLSLYMKSWLQHFYNVGVAPRRAVRLKNSAPAIESFLGNQPNKQPPKWLSFVTYKLQQFRHCWTTNTGPYKCSHACFKV